MSKRFSIIAAALAASRRNLLTTVIDGSGRVLVLETKRNDGLSLEERSRLAIADLEEWPPGQAAVQRAIWLALG